MNKGAIAIIVVVFVVGSGYLLFKNEQSKPPVPEPPAILESLRLATTTEQIIAEEKVIIYTDSGYSPNILTIQNGETVIFQNRSSKSMWPASALHPSHRVYSGTSLNEHCPDTTGIAFDACKGFLPNETWSFKFEKTGTWKFHDHLNLGNFGTIIVQ